MSTFGEQSSAAFSRATARAKAILQPGDRLTMGGCGGGVRTVTFSHWSDVWGVPDPNGKSFSSKSLDDLHAWNISKVNGQAISFRDEEGEIAVQRDNERFNRERAHRRALSIQGRRRALHVVASGGLPMTSPPPVEQVDHVEIKSGICGNHFNAYCISCQSSRDFNDRMITATQDKDRRIAELQKQVAHLKREIGIKDRTLHEKNIALDGLGWVWCDGGCPKGVGRFTDFEATEEVVASMERNTDRLRRWLNNRESRRARATFTKGPTE